MSVIKQISDSILRHSIEEKGVKHRYGVRVDDDEKNIPPGSPLENSRVWRNGDPTNKMLSGLSAIKIRSHRPEHVEEALDNLGALGKAGPNGYYYGKKVRLIHSEEVGSGKDAKEGIFKNPRLLGEWEKPSEGLSAVEPNARMPIET